MAINEILPFATAPGANVVTQAEYAADPKTVTGFSPGVAESKKLNKVWRQSSFIAAGIAEYMKAQGVDVADDGNLEAFVGNLTTALGIGRVVGSVSALRALPKGGTPNAFVTGYYGEGDGGGGAYFLFALTAPPGTDNGATDIVANDGGWWKLIWQGALSAKQFGAVGDGVADDTLAVKAAVSYLESIGGGTLHWPQGAYKVTDEILISSASIRFTGTGRRKTYPGLFVPSADTVSTIMPVHSKTAAIRVFSAALNTASTFSMSDINLATLEAGEMPVCAVGFDGAGNFQRDFTFERVGIHGFTSAFDTYNVGGDTAFGTAKISNCAINRNQYIARNVTGQWNSFIFEDNEAGQNTVGGLSIKAQAGAILGNCLEGQPNAIYVSGTYRGLTIGGNYFELNNGDYVIKLSNTVGAVVDLNYWQNCTAVQKLALEYDVGTTVNDFMVPSTLGSFDLRTRDNAIDPAPLGAASAAFFYKSELLKTNAFNGGVEFGGYQVTPSAPHPDIPGSAGASYATSGAGLMTYTKASLAYASGTWFAVAVAVSYVDVPALPPRMELRVNSNNSDGFTNPIFYNFHRAAVNLKNKTVIYFGLVKATQPVTSFQFFLYPFGLNPAPGLVASVGAPALYNLGASLPETLYSGTSVAAGVPDTHVQMVGAAPLAGTWPVGYRLKHRAPAAAGFEGTICTAAGTPGTWKGYGAIAA